MYITSRPDKVASEKQWLQLEQEVRLGDSETATLHPFLRAQGLLSSCGRMGATINSD